MCVIYNTSDDGISILKVGPVKPDPGSKLHCFTLKICHSFETYLSIWVFDGFIELGLNGLVWFLFWFCMVYNSVRLGNGLAFMFLKLGKAIKAGSSCDFLILVLVFFELLYTKCFLFCFVWLEWFGSVISTRYFEWFCGDVTLLKWISLRSWQIDRLDLYLFSIYSENYIYWKTNAVSLTISNMLSLVLIVDLMKTPCH